MLYKKIEFTLYERDRKRNLHRVGDKKTEFIPATKEDILRELILLKELLNLKVGE